MVIPTKLKTLVLRELHSVHTGIEKMKVLARDTVGGLLSTRTSAPLFPNAPTAQKCAISPPTESYTYLGDS